jgi:hypothetical protein
MRAIDTTRRLGLLAGTGLLVLLPLLAQPITALATPDIARQTGQPCSTCHVNPGGGGPRNAVGQAFEALPNHDADPAAAWAQLVASGRAGGPAAVQVPAALPRAGDGAVPSGWGAAVGGAVLVLAGALLRRRGWRA